MFLVIFFLFCVVVGFFGGARIGLWICLFLLFGCVCLAVWLWVDGFCFTSLHGAMLSLVGCGSEGMLRVGLYSLLVFARLLFGTVLGCVSCRVHRFYIDSLFVVMCGLTMETVTVSKKYQLVIPQKLRKDAKIKPGDKMVAITKHGII